MNLKRCQVCESERICFRTTVYTDETEGSMEFNVVEIKTKYCFDCGLYTVVDVPKKYTSSNDSDDICTDPNVD